MPGKLKRNFIVVLLNIILVCSVPGHLWALNDNDSSYLNHISFPGIKADPAFPADSSSFIIPFSRAGNLILIKARVDSTEGNFILDTGCPGLVLNITYFRNYTRIAESDAENDGITGSFGVAEHTIVKDFHFGSIRQYNVKGDLVSLGNIENSKGVKVLGLVGMRFLKDCEMIIDFEKNQIHFHIISKKEASKYNHPMLNDTSMYQVIPFDITDNRIMVKTVMEGKKVRFVIDCAAETNILDSRLPDKIFENVSITGRVLLSGVGSKKIEAVKGNLANFKLGNRNITEMPVLITNLEKTCFSHGGCVDGVLGFDFLSLQKIGFNFVTRKMFIWK